jgi:hypothetical protein
MAKHARATAPLEVPGKLSARDHGAVQVRKCPGVIDRACARFVQISADERQLQPHATRGKDTTRWPTCAPTAEMMVCKCQDQTLGACNGITRACSRITRIHACKPSIFIAQCWFDTF